MQQFHKIEEETSSRCLPNAFGYRPSPAAIAKRGDRVALRAMLAQVGGLHEALPPAKEGCAAFVAASTRLLKRLQLLVGDGSPDAADGWSAEDEAALASLRHACAQKPKGSVAAAVRTLRGALAEVHAAGALAGFETGVEAGADAGAAGAPPADARTADAAPPADAPPARALSEEEITEKLNAAPTFVLLAADKQMLTVRSEASGAQVATWFTDAAEAEAALAGIEARGDVAGARLGVVPLGLAFRACGGAAGAPAEPPAGFEGELRLQGASGVVEAMAPMLKQQLEAQGLDAGAWQLPLFLCDELSSPSFMPVFFSKDDLLEAWVASGRPQEQAPSQLAVIDLRVLVAQMRTDKYAWSTVQFLCSRRAGELADSLRPPRPKAAAA